VNGIGRFVDIYITPRKYAFRMELQDHDIIVQVCGVKAHFERDGCVVTIECFGFNFRVRALIFESTQPRGRA
jgi:hypothetical protein